MPIILNKTISDVVYQNKDVLDMFSDTDYPKFILMNPNIFFLVDIFLPYKNDIQGKYLDAIY